VPTFDVGSSAQLHFTFSAAKASAAPAPGSNSVRAVDWLYLLPHTGAPNIDASRAACRVRTTGGLPVSPCVGDQQVHIRQSTGSLASVGVILPKCHQCGKWHYLHDARYVYEEYNPLGQQCATRPRDCNYTCSLNYKALVLSRLQLACRDEVSRQRQLYMSGPDDS
jgi:hypothetical protein